MTPLQLTIRDTVHTLEEKIEECLEHITRIRDFCKHDSCYVDMKVRHGSFIPVKLCVCCGKDMGVPTTEEQNDCITMYDNAMRKKKLL